MPKAIGLISGGLDSVLATRLLMDQEIQLTGLSFQTPFFGPDQARRATTQLAIPLVVKEIGEEHLELVRRPPHGYGSAMNPCIDCHALMIRKAGEVMVEEGHDFIFTGEVLNERPMSQNRRSLDLVAKLSGFADFLLRPLSARLLPETKMEKEGLVERRRLLDLQGRSRKRQLALAQAYGLTEFSAPAGGCLLTDQGFSKKLKELFAKGGFDLADINLLKVGRHFRIQDLKVIVGRNASENQRLKELAREEDTLLSAEHLPGPVALARGEASEELLLQAAGVCLAFSDFEEKDGVAEIEMGGQYEGNLRPPRLSRQQVEKFRI